MSEQQNVKGEDGKSAGQKLADLILSRKQAFRDVATEYLPAERLVKLAQVAIAKTPDLLKCSTLSVMESLMLCARTGLEPGEPGGIWLVPFKGQCTPIVDYRGMIDVARRSGAVLAVHAGIRRERDSWEYRIDTTSPTMVVLRHVPADGDRGAVVGAYFVARLKNGECQAAYLSAAEVEAFRARSKADRAGFSPWKSDWEAMAMKTACRRGVNLLPKTPELQALQDAIKHEDVDGEVIGVDLPEGNTEAAERMLEAIAEEDKAAASAIADLFVKAGYGPAKRVQALTAFRDDTAGLIERLRADVAKAPGVSTPAVAELPAPAPAEDMAAKVAEAAAKKPEPEPVKRKPGRPKKSPTVAPEPFEAQPVDAPAEVAKPRRTFTGGSF